MESICLSDKTITHILGGRLAKTLIDLVACLCISIGLPDLVCFVIGAYVGESYISIMQQQVSEYGSTGCVKTDRYIEDVSPARFVGLVSDVL